MSKPTDPFVTGYITTDTIDSARKITQLLLEKKLIACANIAGGVESHYWWQGQLEHSHEQMIILKTKKSLVAKINDEVHKVHPYEVPCITFYEISYLNSDFADWMSVILKSNGQ